MPGYVGVLVSTVPLAQSCACYNIIIIIAMPTIIYRDYDFALVANIIFSCNSKVE